MELFDLQRGILLRNAWYVAAYSTEVTSSPLSRRLCGERVVLYRTASGAAVALEDRCAHRGMPLSAGGECEGEIIRCPYHGMEYGPSGACTKIPGQDRVPAGTRVHGYPLVERDHLLWIWTGDPAKADAADVISWPYHTSPEWVHTKGFIALKANWQLLADNLLNLNHLQYVHKTTIGSRPAEGEHAEIKAQRVGDKVLMAHWLREVDPPPMHRMAYGFKGKVDRWQECEFVPGHIQFYSGSMDSGTGAYEGRRVGGLHIRHFHATTPETEHTSHYFFTSARNFKLDDTALTEKLHQSMLVTFDEDKVVLEAQQARLLELGSAVFIDRKDDAASLHARRLVRDLLAKEQATAHAAALDKPHRVAATS